MTNDELLALGQQLRTVRLERGYSLEQVATTTKIRPRFLEAIEAGEQDPLLTDMQLRGFLRNYATFLHLDLEAMLAAYRQAVEQGQRQRSGLRKLWQSEAPPPEVPIIPIKPDATIKTPPRAISPVKMEVYEGGRNWLVVLTSVIVGGVLVLGAVLVVFLIINSLQTSTPTTSEALTSPAPLVIEGATELLTRTPDPKGTVEILYTPTLSEETSPTAGGVLINTPSQPNMTGADSIAIAVRAIQRSWVKVTVDGTVQYEGILRPGTALQYQGQRTIIFRTSNAGGVEVVINNQNLGTLGGRGELYEQTFSLDALATPTAALPTDIPPGASGDGAIPTADTNASQPQPQATEPPLNLPTPLPVPSLLATDVPVEATTSP